jgi:hypothetical protein
MLSHKEAQELHRLIGAPIETAREGYDGDLEVSAVMVPVKDLERARELAALIVADTEPSPVSYDPCITGKVEIGGQTSEFLLPLDNDSVRYSQWGADNTVLWPRTDLMDALAGAAREWALDNLRTEEDDNA